MKPTYVIAFVILVGAAISTMVALGGSVAPHVTIQQAKARAGTVVQVPGTIVKDTVRYDGAGGRGVLRFDVVALDGSKETMTVVYAQPKPQSFDTAVFVEAVGKYEDGVFKAHTLLVKCPSKYAGQDGADKSPAAAGR